MQGMSTAGQAAADQLFDSSRSRQGENLAAAAHPGAAVPRDFDVSIVDVDSECHIDGTDFRRHFPDDGRDIAEELKGDVTVEVGLRLQRRLPGGSAVDMAYMGTVDGPVPPSI